MSDETSDRPPSPDPRPKSVPADVAAQARRAAAAAKRYPHRELHPRDTGCLVPPYTPPVRPDAGEPADPSRQAALPPSLSDRARAWVRLHLSPEPSGPDPARDRDPAD